MPALPPSTPVLIGAAQHTVHKHRQPGPEPLDAWAAACRAAADDAGIGPQGLTRADAIALTHCMSWAYDDGIARLADQLGATPTIRRAGAPSGTSGQKLLDALADDIRAGRARLAVLCGGEALATLRHYLKAGQTPPWRFQHPDPQAHHVDLAGQQHPGEVAIGLFDGVGAVYQFAMRDVARRAHLGIAPDAYRRQLGELLSGLSRVAADNPDAWSGTARDPDFLITPRDDNRWVSYPYTKHMVAHIEVDISAAVILTSEAMADELGVPQHRRVYPWTSAYVEDPAYIAVREHLWKADGMAVASQAALDAAGITIDDVAHVDLYSCFASAVNFARDALGIAHWPGERVSLTGGLPYGGGPASSYMLTSLVKMVQALRATPGSHGLLSGVGMMMSHHVFSVYASQAPTPEVRPVDQAALQATVDAIPQREIDNHYAGPATVTTYTLMYDRHGTATHGAAICDLPSGARAYARILDADLLAQAEHTELVGQPVEIVAGPDVGSLRRTRP